MNRPENISFFLTHGEYTDPKEHTSIVSDLGGDLRTLVTTIQGLLIHDFFGKTLYDDPPKAAAFASRETLPIADRLSQIVIRENDPPLSELPTSDRLVGTCRDFALMLCAFLRQNRVAARVRCGFANYVGGEHYEDHWLCEYWDEGERRWIKVDAQLDEAHRQHLNIDFDPYDVPDFRFIVAHRAWELIRTDAMEADWFGSGEHRGLWFVRINTARDLMALCKHEKSPWDDWRNMSEPERTIDEHSTAEGDWMADRVRMIETGVLEAGSGLGPI